ncbi:MAG TPA: hypothetical protein VIY47_06060 [Ignavibacteriaceae bacterium]
MKNLIVSLSAALVVLIIGCQENSITEPVLNEPAEKVQVETPENYFRGIITLESVLRDPYSIGNSFYLISGQIEYNLRKINMDSNLSALQQNISIHLDVKADLQNFCTVCPAIEVDNLSGFISEISDSVAPVAGNTASLFERNFTIQGREDGMVLKTRFSISKDEVKLNAMWLALPNTHELATEIINY